MRATLLAVCLSAASLAAQDSYGLVETVVHTYGPFDLRASALQQMPPRMEVVFPEDLWLVGYHTKILDAGGKPISREFQCHTFLGTSLPAHHSHDQVVGLFSDGYTEDFALPPGFGIFLKGGQRIYWTPMFNNRQGGAVSASMHLTLDVIRGVNVRRPLVALATTFRTIKVPDLYYVEPGTDVQETTFTLPFAGRIHAMGTHIHPYGVAVEVLPEAGGEPIWKAEGKLDASGRLVAMPQYSNAEGYRVRAGDRFRLRATYRNTTDKPVDAMAGVFLLYAAEDGEHAGHTDK